ncbi:amino acid ABC transporter permease [Pseudahrensia aquimaris]|uniref:Amino acid ABC transporter permease n=1 Tax=Pseudahrensia aquimaris TaxID=744461 RepID=A0ABW3FGT8_9HYPH
MTDTRNEIAFVATKDIPPSPPPSEALGWQAWVRENLFATPRDSILTIICGFLIVYGLMKILPWLVFDSVWIADSIRQCREIDSGACFAVITERFNQLLFGFYPGELYWRPILTFFLMFVAIAPVLHDNLPRKMLYFSMLFPLLAFWLLWGGSVWTVILVMLAVIGCALMFNALSKFMSNPLAMLVAFLTLLIYFYAAHGPLMGALAGNIPLISLEPVETSKFGGFMLTFIIGVTGIAMSLPIGILLALGRKSDMPVVKMLCVGFIEFIRGVPLITLLFVASTLLNYFLPPGTNFDLMLRVIIMVTLFASAYMAEVIRGGLAALPRGQYEAADALGLNYSQATQLIVLPQALKISIPGIVNTFIGLFKDTTLVSIIGLLDPIGIMQPIRSSSDWNGIIWELPLFIGLVFFVFCFMMSRYSMYFERKLDTGHRN